MPYLPLSYFWSPLYVAQAALTIWMLIDANRRGVEFYWFWLILAFQPLTLHASSAATSPGHRRVVHLEFATGALPGGLAWYHAV